MAVIHLNRQDFQKEVLEADGKVLVDFFATWCGPCKLLAPVMEELAEECPQYKICKVDVDEAAELAEQYQVMSVPTMVLFTGGKEADRMTGAVPKERIIGMIERNPA